MVPDPAPSSTSLPAAANIPRSAPQHTAAAAGLLLVGGVVAFVASFLPFEWVYSSAPDYPLKTPAPPSVYGMAQVPGILMQYAAITDSTPDRVGYRGLALLAAFLLWGVPLGLTMLGALLLVQRRRAVRPHTRRRLQLLLALEFAWFLFYLVTFAIGHMLDSQDQSTPQVGAALLVLSYLGAGAGALLLPVTAAPAGSER